MFRRVVFDHPEQQKSTLKLCVAVTLPNTHDLFLLLNESP